MSLKKIYADFNNADVRGRVRLNNQGTIQDINNQRITLESGLNLLLSDDDSLEAIGIVEFSDEEKIWVAKIDWDVFK